MSEISTTQIFLSLVTLLVGSGFGLGWYTRAWLYELRKEREKVFQVEHKFRYAPNPNRLPQTPPTVIHEGELTYLDPNDPATQAGPQPIVPDWDWT